eukprot:1894173-Prymnesium_polylepis.2
MCRSPHTSHTLLLGAALDPRFAGSHLSRNTPHCIWLYRMLWCCAVLRCCQLSANVCSPPRDEVARGATRAGYARAINARMLVHVALSWANAAPSPCPRRRAQLSLRALFWPLVPLSALSFFGPRQLGQRAGAARRLSSKNFWSLTENCHISWLLVRMRARGWVWPYGASGSMLALAGSAHQKRSVALAAREV